MASIAHTMVISVVIVGANVITKGGVVPRYWGLNPGHWSATLIDKKRSRTSFKDFQDLRFPKHLVICSPKSCSSLFTCRANVFVKLGEL